MPIARISVPQSLAKEQVAAVSDSIHESLTATFNVPADDRFHIISRHSADELVCTPNYLGVDHSDRVVFIQITCNEGRSLDMKKALFAQIARHIPERTSIQAADIIISLVEVRKENWSVGNGIAQYA